MAQFDVYRNRNPATRTRFPLLLDVQSDMLDPLATRVVVPLAPAGAAQPRSMTTLMPALVIDGKEYVAYVPQLAGIPAAELRSAIANVRHDRGTIVAALDMLVTGI